MSQNTPLEDLSEKLWRSKQCPLGKINNDPKQFEESLNSTLFKGNIHKKPWGAESLQQMKDALSGKTK